MVAPSCSVLAVVLTHDAPDALDACLRALERQVRPPDAVLVVDNRSRPAARPPELALPVDVLRTDRNDGPAGGHAAGLAAFLARREHTHAWVLDDDMVPRPGCLAALLAAVGDDADRDGDADRHDGADRDDDADRDGDPGRSVVVPLIHDVDGSVRRWPAWCGPLLPRRVVVEAGLPRTELVWWAEDTEYLQWRLPRRGVAVRWVEGAEVDHLRTRSSAEVPPWKVYYEVRNSVYVRLHVKRQRRDPRKLLRTLGRLLWRVARRRDGRGRTLVLYGRGVVDGLDGRLGTTVPLGEDERRSNVPRPRATR